MGGRYSCREELYVSTEKPIAIKKKREKKALDEDKGEAICHDNTPAKREVFHLEQFFQIRIKFIWLL